MASCYRPSLAAGRASGVDDHAANETPAVPFTWDGLAGSTCFFWSLLVLHAALFRYMFMHAQETEAAPHDQDILAAHGAGALCANDKTQYLSL